MKELDSISGYQFPDAHLDASHEYLLPDLLKVLKQSGAGLKEAGLPLRTFDLGCGNGSVARAVASHGWAVTGIDPSIEGNAQFESNDADQVSLHRGSAYSDLKAEYGQFPVVYSLEVVEHLYAPRDFAKTLFNLVAPGGAAVVSTPYHGYLKNLVLAASGKMDAHFTALWDHGHIKFWSQATLRELLEEAGFTALRFRRVGRVPSLAKSMIAICRKPA